MGWINLSGGPDLPHQLQVVTEASGETEVSGCDMQHFFEQATLPKEIG